MLQNFIMVKINWWGRFRICFLFLANFWEEVGSSLVSKISKKVKPELCYVFNNHSFTQLLRINYLFPSLSSILVKFLAYSFTEKYYLLFFISLYSFLTFPFRDLKTFYVLMFCSSNQLHQDFFSPVTLPVVFQVIITSNTTLRFF